MGPRARSAGLESSTRGSFPRRQSRPSSGTPPEIRSRRPLRCSHVRPEAAAPMPPARFPSGAQIISAHLLLRQRKRRRAPRPRWLLRRPRRLTGRVGPTRPPRRVVAPGGVLDRDLHNFHDASHEQGREAQGECEFDRVEIGRSRAMKMIARVATKSPQDGKIAV